MSFPFAQRNGQLHRNFLKDTPLMLIATLWAMGVSAISQVGHSTIKTTTDINLYQAAPGGRLPVKRGVWLIKDDLIRKAVIMELICQFSLDIASFEASHKITFASYFGEELTYLGELEKDGLIALGGNKIEVSSPGRLLIRAICKQF